MYTIMGPMVWGHGLFQKATTVEPAGTVAVNWGLTVVPGVLHAMLASVASVIGLVEL